MLFLKATKKKSWTISLDSLRDYVLVYFHQATEPDTRHDTEAKAMFSEGQIIHGKVLGTFKVVRTKVAVTPHDPNGLLIVVVREVCPQTGMVASRKMNFRADMFREFQG